jgi:hypothetical protein
VKKFSGCSGSTRIILGTLCTTLVCLLGMAPQISEVQSADNNASESLHFDSIPEGY